MSSIIVSGTTVLYGCATAVTDLDGTTFAIVNGTAQAVFPPSLGVSVVNDVTLPSPWPGYGYTYAGGLFTALPAPVVVPPVPDSVTPRQARLALSAAGLLDVADAAVAAADKATQITWDYATEIRPDNPLIWAVASGLTPPLTRDQIADLFRTAATF